MSYVLGNRGRHIVSCTRIVVFRIILQCNDSSLNSNWTRPFYSDDLIPNEDVLTYTHRNPRAAIQRTDFPCFYNFIFATIDRHSWNADERQNYFPHRYHII